MNDKNGIYIGMQYLPNGEYTINGGLGNKVLRELKVEDGILYTRDNENEDWKIKQVPPMSEFKMPQELDFPMKDHRTETKQKYAIFGYSVGWIIATIFFLYFGHLIF